ncbi:MAG TPA: alpha-D-ribose 1-methylphosphonate 5-phosphate C-P-lyase PhnJ [Spirochaetia bacterium]
MTLEELLPRGGAPRYNFAFIDEGAKREMRRALLKAVAIPGHQVPFASPELPIARGWGTGGLQVTMSIIGPHDVLKIIDQGCDGSVNAVNLRKLLVTTTGVRTTFDSREATILQSRHRLPEISLRAGQIAVLQVPLPEPLRLVEPSEVETRRMHGEGDYARMWVSLYEDVVQNGAISLSWGYPCRVNGSYIMSPSPLPRWDLPLLHRAEHLTLFGAGREKRVYAVPPYTSVRPLEFEDLPFETESFPGMACSRCGSTGTYLDEVYDEATGRPFRVCSDSGFCDLVVAGAVPPKMAAPRPMVAARG